MDLTYFALFPLSFHEIAWLDASTCLPHSSRRWPINIDLPYKISILTPWRSPRWLMLWATPGHATFFFPQSLGKKKRVDMMDHLTAAFVNYAHTKLQMQHYDSFLMKKMCHNIHTTHSSSSLSWYFLNITAGNFRTTSHSDQVIIDHSRTVVLNLRPPWTSRGLWARTWAVCSKLKS